MSETNKFTFFKSYYDAMADLPPEDFKKVVCAMCSHAFYDTDMKDLTGTQKAIYALILPVLNKSIKISNNRSDAGKKGGETTNNQSKVETHFKQSESKSEANDKQSESKPQADKDIGDRNKDIGVGDKEKENIIASLDAMSETDNALEVVLEKWNNTSFPAVSRLKRDSKRGAMLIARIKEYGLDDVLKAIEIANNSDYLHSEKAVSWFDFEWFVRPNNFPKVLEGKYNNRDDTKVRQRRTEKDDKSENISIPTEFDYRQTSESKIMSYAEWVYKYYGVELTDEVHTV